MQEKRRVTGNSSDATSTTRTDLAEDIMGNNELQGNDQLNVRNERQAQADVKSESDSLIESFKKRDKDFRAKTDLGKGNRS